MVIIFNKVIFKAFISFEITIITFFLFWTITFSLACCSIDPFEVFLNSGVNSRTTFSSAYNSHKDSLISSLTFTDTI